jgi:enoyl-CoA hydratase/carnithine racemase
MFKAVSKPLPDLKDWHFSVDQWGIAWAEFDREGESQNSLGRRPLEELAKIVEVVETGAKAREIRGLVISSGKERGFIATLRHPVGEVTSPRQPVSPYGIRRINRPRAYIADQSSPPDVPATSWVHVIFL